MPRLDKLLIFCNVLADLVLAPTGSLQAWWSGSLVGTNTVRGVMARVAGAGGHRA